MQNRSKVISAVAYTVAIATGVLTLASQAAAANDPPQWHCEYCRCAFPQNVCSCYNCTFY